MGPAYRLLSSSGYRRDVRKLIKRNKELLRIVKALQEALEINPYDSTTHDIRKLTDVKQGEGQYRIRSGNYRIRYDVIDNDVILYSFSDRKSAY